MTAPVLSTGALGSKGDGIGIGFIPTKAAQNLGESNNRPPHIGVGRERRGSLNSGVFPNIFGLSTVFHHLSTVFGASDVVVLSGLCYSACIYGGCLSVRSLGRWAVIRFAKNRGSDLVLVQRAQITKEAIELAFIRLLCPCRMPKVGIEPTLPREHDFESCASACSATSAGLQR